MNLALILYLINILANLKSFILFILLVLIIVFILSSIYKLSKKDNFISIKHRRTLIMSFILLGIVHSLIPHPKTMYIMTGLVVGEKILKSEKGNELLDKSYQVVITKLDQAIDETIPKQEKETTNE